MFGGIFFNLTSLFADGMHTFSDFVTDIVCLISAKLSKRRPTKNHPFGFGKIEYLTNVFIGIILLALGIFIIFHAFTGEKIIPPLSVLILLAVTLVLKLISIYIMHRTGEKINSQLLITAVKESSTDLYSTIGVMIITVLLQFSSKFPILSYTDILGSILIAFIVFKTSFHIMLENSLSLIGEVEDNKEIINKVKEYIVKHKHVENQKIFLIKYGAYYKLQLTLVLDPKITLKSATRIEDEIKKDIIRHRSLHIKYVTIFITDKI